MWTPWAIWTRCSSPAAPAPEEGILVKVENGTGGQRLQVSAFNGETRRYTLPAGAGVTVNGVVGTVSRPL